MAENGNRGPNDFRTRNAKRRREPPIIDASATEVPLDAREPAAEERADEAPVTGAELPDAEAGAAPAGGADAAEPVLFGSALRENAPKADTAEPSAAAVPDAADLPAGPGAAAAPADEAPAPETVAAGTAAPEPSAPPSSAPSFGGSGTPVPPAAARSGGAAPWILSLCILALLGALAWLIYTEPQRSGREDLAALRDRVAGLEARPDAGQATAAVDKRLAAADAERAGLAKSVADLSSRLDALAQQAQQAGKAGADQPSGEAAAATVGALGALAGKVDALDGRLADLARTQGETERSVAALPKPVAPDFGPVDAKVAALAGQVNALDGKVNGSDARLNAFDAKVNAVDGKINGFDARMNAFENRTNGIEAKVNESAAGLGRLEASVANLPRVDLAPLQSATTALDGRVAKVEAQLSAAKDGARVTEARAVGSADETRATPLALVGQSVASAIGDGRPYGADLAALKALGAEPDALAKLEPLAAKGAPTAAALREQWEALQGGVLAAVKPAGTGSALERLEAGARSLVQVRRVGAVAGDDPAALVSQVDAALAEGDVAGALAAWNKLPQAAQDRSRDWAAAARGREAAAAAADGVVNRAIATLGRTKG